MCRLGISPSRTSRSSAERIKAWKDGPVIPQVWHARKDQATRRAAAQDVDNIELDELTSDLIDLVLAAYGSMSGDELSALTHVEEPWLEARGDLSEEAASQVPIAGESMAQFYRAHRRLGGRTAADLAAGGIHLRSHEVSDPVDVDAILDSLGGDYADAGDDPWGARTWIAETSMKLEGSSRHIGVPIRVPDRWVRGMRRSGMPSYSIATFIWT